MLKTSTLLLLSTVKIKFSFDKLIQSTPIHYAYLGATDTNLRLSYIDINGAQCAPYDAIKLTLLLRYIKIT
ncbi:MAG: hypothetical protein ACI8WB_002554 [Phenylobacterium sp.]|jgi:hypothetical protein